MAKTKSKKVKKKNYRLRFTWIGFTIFMVLAILIGCTYFVKDPIEKYVAEMVGYTVKNTEFGSVIETGDLEVHFIDVGQGDSIAIRFPDDQTMLIDAGKSSAEKQLISYLDNTFFKNDPTREFDYVMLTHSDADHCGSIVAIYEEYQVNNSIRPYEYSTVSKHEPAGNPNGAREKSTKTYAKYIDAVYDENDVEDDSDIIYAHAGYTIPRKESSAPYLMEFITPQKTLYNDANDYSPIVLLEYKEMSFLFTGDAQAEQFAELESAINTNPALKTRLSRVTVYKAAHHGSSLHNSNNLSILQKLNPEYVVIEVGEGNSYKHPHQDFLDNLATAGITNIYRTDLNGNILFGVSTTNGSLNLVTSKELEDVSYVSSSDAPAPPVLYYSWEIMAGTLIFVLFILCFYDYAYKKRKIERQLETIKNLTPELTESEGKAAPSKKKKTKK